MEYTNRTLARVREGQTSFGIFQGLPSVALTEIMANRPLDWILVDMEHGAIELESAGNLFAAIACGGPTPLARVATNDQATIKRVLDAGAMGVMIPMINSPEEAARAVEYCHYAPAGSRGIGPGRTSLYGVRMVDYLANADGHIMVIPQIEHTLAVKRIDAILAVPGIDVAFIGPYDLSCSMGLPGQVGHPDVEKAISIVLKAAEHAHVAPGIFCMDPEAARKRAEQGFRFVALGLDSVYFDRAISGSLDRVRG